jgi:hypothetical protein
MSDFVEVNGQPVPVEAYKYTIIDTDSPGIDKFPTIQYKHADKEQIKRMAEEEEYVIQDMKALVSVENIE